MDTINNRVDEIHAIKIEIGACGIVDNRYNGNSFNNSIIIIINGHQVPAQAIATKVNIIKVKSIILQLVIRSSGTRSDAHTVIYIELYDAVITGTFLTYALQIESVIGIIDYDMDAIDAITAPINVSGITNYSSSILDVLELKIGFIIIIGYHLDTIDPITVENGFIIIIGYHLDTIHPITVENGCVCYK